MKLKMRPQIIFIFTLFLFNLNLSGCAKFLADLKSDADAPAQEDDIASMDMGENDYSEHSRDSSSRNMFEPPQVSQNSVMNDLEVEGSLVERNGKKPGSETQTELVRPSGRVTKEDFVDQSQEEGSLWASSGQTNYYFTKNRIRSPGDLISMTIDEELHRGIQAEIKKVLSYPERFQVLQDAREQLGIKLLKTAAADPVPSLPDAKKPSVPNEVAETKVEAKNTDLQKGTPESPVEGSPSRLTQANLAKQLRKLKLADLDLSDSFGVKAGDQIMGEVVSRFPNGNYRIKGIKRVAYKQGRTRLVSVTGVVKSTDINEDTDKVTPGSLYEYQIEVSN